MTKPTVSATILSIHAQGAERVYTVSKTAVNINAKEPSRAASKELGRGLLLYRILHQHWLPAHSLVTPSLCLLSPRRYIGLILPNTGLAAEAQTARSVAQPTDANHRPSATDECGQPRDARGSLGHVLHLDTALSVRHEPFGCALPFTCRSERRTMRCWLTRGARRASPR